MTAILLNDRYSFFFSSGYGSQHQGEEKVHGSPLSGKYAHHQSEIVPVGSASGVLIIGFNLIAADDIKNVKQKFGFNPEEKYAVSQEVYDFWAKIAEQNAKVEAEWNELVAKYNKEFPTEAAELKRRLEGKLPEGWEKALPRFNPGDAAVATRKLSETVLTALSDVVPELIGGSADLTGSNLTRWKKAVDFQHPSTGLGQYDGRYVRYGVREHAMFAIMNGIAAYQGLIPFGGTFLNFLTYGWGATRLSAVSHLRVIYVMTHDSIGLGEDGPTHQPIETLALVRATPNIYTMRPADGNETSGCYLVALENDHRPSVIALSRQNLPQLEGSNVEAVRKGAYVLHAEQKPDVVLAATGSEVAIAVEAAKLLEKEGLKVQTVSMPITDLFDEQSHEYKLSVFPKDAPVVSVEALTVFGWQQYSHAQVGMTTFGASGVS